MKHTQDILFYSNILARRQASLLPGHGTIILFLNKMVNTILSCDSIAGRRWRREMYGLRFLRLRR